MRAPPGRAGHLWLRRRLAVAERGVDVLRRKQQLLRGQREVIARDLAGATEVWESSCREARVWLRRAVDAAGHQQLPQIAADADPAVVSIEWISLMNLHMPARGHADVPKSLVRRTASLGGSAAFDRAAECAAAAVRGSVTVATTRAALDAIDAELASTTRHIRLLQRRRLPDLRSALEESARRLEETERDDVTRARWAARVSSNRDQRRDGTADDSRGVRPW